MIYYFGLKAMSATIDRVGAELASYVEKLVAKGEDVNARDLASRFTTQSIATAGSCFIPFCGSNISYAEKYIKILG